MEKYVICADTVLIPPWKVTTVHDDGTCMTLLTYLYTHWLSVCFRTQIAGASLGAPRVNCATSCWLK